jgi:hypothetical protein
VLTCSSFPQLYNVINKRLPGWQDPPSSRDIKVHSTSQHFVAPCHLHL